MSVREARNEYERKVLDNIRTHRWHCTSVIGDEDGPPFSYTVGLYESFKHPELMIIGLPHETAHGILSVAARAAASDAPYDLSLPTDRLIENYSALFVEVPKSKYEDYLGTALWYYRGDGFPVQQIVWPSAQGLFPWHPDATPGFVRTQPVLGAHR